MLVCWQRLAHHWPPCFWHALAADLINVSSLPPSPPADTGMYWDSSSGGFYSSGDGKWYSWDAGTQAFVEWAAAPGGK